jgi:two-component system, OmpR family, response regulator
MNTMPELVIAVDDEHDNLELIERILSKYEVKTFTDPRAALEEAIQLKPIAVVVDYRMPGMTGLELVRKCREAGLDSAILMVTAFPDLDEITYAAQNELVYQVVPKPYRPDRLRDWMRLAIIQTKMNRRQT